MDLNDMNQNDRINQMLRSEKAFARTINLIPTYMRPPFGRCHKECLQDMGNLGYHVVFWNVDPKDSQFNTEKTYPEAIQRFDTDLRYGGSLVGCHDTEQYTAAKLVPHMIAELKKRGLQGVTLGECLGDPRENWYRHVLR